MAEAERIIGTPDIPEAAGAEPEHTDKSAASGERSDSSAAREPAEPTGPSGSGSGSEENAAQAERPRGKRRIAVLFTVAALAYVLDLVSGALRRVPSDGLDDLVGLGWLDERRALALDVSGLGIVELDSGAILRVPGVSGTGLAWYPAVQSPLPLGEGASEGRLVDFVE